MTPQPIDYPRNFKKPPARWCLPAAIGFALSLPGPVVGFALARGLDAFHVAISGDLPFIALVFTPMFVGLILCLVSLRITSRALTRIRGGGLAAAGVVFCGIWVGLFVVLAAILMSH